MTRYLIYFSTSISPSLPSTLARQTLRIAFSASTPCSNRLQDTLQKPSRTLTENTLGIHMLRTKQLSTTSELRWAAKLPQDALFLTRCRANDGILRLRSPCLQLQLLGCLSRKAPSKWYIH
jgi:hypothetical protein